MGFRRFAVAAIAATLVGVTPAVHAAQAATGLDADGR